MNKSEFTELAYNDHRTALLTLWELYEKLRAEQDATQATLLQLATVVNGPVEA